MRIFLSMVTLSTLAAFSFSPAYSYGGSEQDAVINDNGSVVVNSSGACVRSKWNAGSDVCAPEPEVEPEPVKKPIVQQVVPQPQPKKEERTVYFDFDSATLTAEGTQKIDTLVQWLVGAKGVTGATVYGYADQMGDVEYNQKLSAKRAAAVESYLAAKGVVLPTNVEIVKGLGESGSVTQCSEAMERAEKIACLAADRRVEIAFEILR